MPHTSEEPKAALSMKNWDTFTSIVMEPEVARGPFKTPLPPLGKLDSEGGPFILASIDVHFKRANGALR